MKGVFAKAGNEKIEKEKYTKPIGMNMLVEMRLEERVKQLMVFAEHPDEVDAIAEAYRKIVGIRSRKKEEGK